MKTITYTNHITTQPQPLAGHPDTTVHLNDGNVVITRNGRTLTFNLAAAHHHKATVTRDGETVAALAFNDKTSVYNLIYTNNPITESATSIYYPRDRFMSPSGAMAHAALEWLS